RLFHDSFPTRRSSDLIMGVSLLAIIGFSAIIRFHFSGFLDPFEDGYQNWWISANLASTGQYWDRHSMMTQGNWLPLYHFSGAGRSEEHTSELQSRSDL